MEFERPLISWKELTQLYEQINGITGDKRTIRKWYASIGVLRRIAGHPAIYVSELNKALHADTNKVKLVSIPKPLARINQP